MNENMTGEAYTRYLKSVCDVPAITSEDWIPAYPEEFKNRIAICYEDEIHIENEHELLTKIPTPEKQQYLKIAYRSGKAGEEARKKMLRLDNKPVYLKRWSLLIPHSDCLLSIKTNPFQPVDIAANVFDMDTKDADARYAKFKQLFKYDRLKYTRFEEKSFARISDEEICLFENVPYEYYSKIWTHDDFLAYSEKDDTFLACDTLEQEDIRTAAEAVKEHGFDIPIYMKIIDGNIVSFKMSKRQMLLALYFGFPTIPACVISTSATLDSLENMVPMSEEAKKLAIDIFGPELTWA